MNPPAVPVRVRFAPSPTGVVEHAPLARFREALHVGVLDPQHERSAVPAGEEPIEVGGPRATHVEPPRRARGEADADGHCGWVHGGRRLSESCRMQSRGRVRGPRGPRRPVRGPGTRISLALIAGGPVSFYRTECTPLL